MQNSDKYAKHISMFAYDRVYVYVGLSHVNLYAATKNTTVYLFLLNHWADYSQF